MNKRESAFIRIAAWSVIAIALISVLILGLKGKLLLNFIGFNSSFYYADSDKYQAGGAGIDGSQVQDLDINWLDGSVKIVVYDGDTVQFFETSSRDLKEKEELHYYNNHGKLLIQYREARRLMIPWGRSLHKKLTVKIPRTTAKAMGIIKVDTVNSDTVMEGITTDKMDLSSVSGDFEMKDCRTQKLVMDSTTGDLTGEALTVEDVLNTETTTGDVNIKGSIKRVDSDSTSGSVSVTSKICPVKIKAETVSGSVMLRIPENDGFTIKHDAVSGDFYSEFQLAYERNRGTYKDGGADFRFETVSGDAAIKKLQ